MTARANHTNKRFGRLTALSYAGSQKWLCICDCGVEKAIHAQSLVTGNTTSCGCYSNELAAKRTAKLNLTHGLTNTPEYNSWTCMRDRMRPSYSNYSRYGGRGITVCKRWNESFENFLSDMGKKPTTEHTLDRIDNDGNYTPENCKWSTSKEQAKNRTNTILITFNDQTKSIREWSEITGIKVVTINARLRVRGWSVEKTLTTPVKYHHP